MHELDQMTVVNQLFPVRDGLESVCRQLEDVGNKSKLNRKLFDARDLVRGWFEEGGDIRRYYGWTDREVEEEE
jgi:hypothetical protein